MPLNYTVADGDSITSLAYQYGLYTDTIWNHPSNAALKAQRESMDVLMPGDVVFIPDKRIEAIEKPTDQMHVFKRKGVPAIFRLQLFDHETPRANQQYVLVVDGTVLQGATDGDGVLEQKISPAARKGELTIGPDAFRLTLQFGTLDPVEEVTGVQKRLKNMGFYRGDATGTMDAATGEALAGFQKRFGLPVTGEADAATLACLRDANDNASDFPVPPNS